MRAGTVTHSRVSSATQTHHIISAHIYSQRSLQLFGRRKKHGSGQHILWQRVEGTARMHAGNRLEGFKPYRPTSTLARMVHTARSAYAHNSLAYIHSHTHTQPSVCRMFQAMCMAKSAAAAAAFATVPSPRVSP